MPLIICDFGEVEAVHDDYMRRIISCNLGEEFIDWEVLQSTADILEGKFKITIIEPF